MSRQAGPYGLTATAPGHAWATARAEAGGDPLEIVLQPAGAITGRVIDPRGRPVRDAWVRVRPPEGPTIEVPPQQAGADPADGSFRLEGLAAGAYDVEVRAAGHGSTRISNVRVAAGGTTEVGELTVAPGGVVRGRVVDTDGQGIAGASVYVETNPDRLTEDRQAVVEVLRAVGQDRGRPRAFASSRVFPGQSAAAIAIRVSAPSRWP